MSSESDPLTTKERRAVAWVKRNSPPHSRYYVIARALERVAPEPKEWVDCTFGEAMVALEEGKRVRRRANVPGAPWYESPVGEECTVAAFRSLRWQRERTTP